MFFMIGLGLSKTHYLLTKDTFALNVQNPKYIKKKNILNWSRYIVKTFLFSDIMKKIKNIRRELKIRTVKICTAFLIIYLWIKPLSVISWTITTTSLNKNWTKIIIIKSEQTTGLDWTKIIIFRRVLGRCRWVH